MSADTKDRAAFLPWLVAAAGILLYLGQLLVPSSALYREVLTPPRVTTLGAACKLAFLLMSAAYGARCARAFDAGSPMRTAWRALTTALWLFFFGVTVANAYVLLGGHGPYHWAGDVLFVLGYPFYYVGFLTALRAYEQAGFAVGSAAGTRATWIVAAAVALVIGSMVIVPTVLVTGPVLDRVLSVAYVVLDLVAAVLLAVLFRVTWRFRGGEVGQMWLTVLAGFLFFFVGDVLLGLVWAFAHAWLEPLVHALYILGYAAVAAGTRHQYRLLAR